MTGLSDKNIETTVSGFIRQFGTFLNLLQILSYRRLIPVFVEYNMNSHEERASAPPTCLPGQGGYPFRVMWPVPATKRESLKVVRPVCF
jgi:hypothetical protein